MTPYSIPGSPAMIMHSFTSAPALPAIFSRHLAAPFHTTAGELASLCCYSSCPLAGPKCMNVCHSHHFCAATASTRSRLPAGPSSPCGCAPACAWGLGPFGPYGAGCVARYPLPPPRKWKMVVVQHNCCLAVAADLTIVVCWNGASGSVSFCRAIVSYFMLLSDSVAPKSRVSAVPPSMLQHWAHTLCALIISHADRGLQLWDCHALCQ
jgi:hypothetical protein